MTHPDVLSEMPESATQPQSDDIPADTQPVISEPPRPQEEEETPPARWRVSRSALLLIGVPLAGALLVWLAISIFGSKPAAAPEAVAEQAAPEPAVEAQPAMEAPSTAESQPMAEAQPAIETPPSIEAQPAMEPQPATEASVASAAEAEPAPVAPEPSQQPDTPSSAVNEVLPKVSQSSLDTIRGTVRVSVRVTVDGQGKVVDAAAADPGPSRYFERISVEAAKKWTFAPASSGEQLVKFNFTRDGVTAQASPAEKLN